RGDSRHSAGGVLDPRLRPCEPLGRLDPRGGPGEEQRSPPARLTPRAPTAAGARALVRVRLDSVRPACVDSRDMLGRVVTRGLEGPRRYPLRRHPPRWHPTVRLRGRLESSYPAIPMADRDLPRWPRARGRVAEGVAPGPGELTGFLGGLVFGETLGFVYSTVGLTLGSILAFAVGRWLGTPMVRRFVPPHMWDRMGFLVKAEGAVLCFLIFLIPGFPKDIACYLFGLSPIPFGVFAV